MVLTFQFFGKSCPLFQKSIIVKVEYSSHEWTSNFRPSQPAGLFGYSSHCFYSCGTVPVEVSTVEVSLWKCPLGNVHCGSVRVEVSLRKRPCGSVNLRKCPYTVRVAGHFHRGHFHRCPPRKSEGHFHSLRKRPPRKRPPQKF